MMSLLDMGVVTLAKLVSKGANSGEDVLSTSLDRALSLSTLVEVPDSHSYTKPAARTCATDAASVHRGGLLTRSKDYGAEARNRLDRDRIVLAARDRHALDERRRAKGRRIARPFSHGDILPTPTKRVKRSDAEALDADGGPELDAMIGSISARTRARPPYRGSWRSRPPWDLANTDGPWNRPSSGGPAQTAISKRRPLGSHLTLPLSTL